MSVKHFFEAYVACALWSSNDETTEQGGEPLDKNYSESDLTENCRETMLQDCREFYEKHSEHFNNDSQAGHDFWLTRNECGVGFLDRKPEVYDGHASTLYEAAGAFPATTLYVTSKGKIDCG